MWRVDKDYRKKLKYKSTGMSIEAKGVNCELVEWLEYGTLVSLDVIGMNENHIKCMRVRLRESELGRDHQ